MAHRWLTRALVAVAVPALLVPTVSSSATAAPKPPAVPTLAAVAEIYPQLEGGYADVIREPVTAPGKDCKPGDPIKGATRRQAFYMPKPADEPDGLPATGEEPVVFSFTARFPSTKSAREFFAADRADTGKCLGAAGPLGPQAKATLKKFRVGLAAESWGYQVTWVTKKATSFATVTTVRKGNLLVGVFTIAGSTAPSIPKTIALTRLVLKTAG